MRLKLLGLFILSGAFHSLLAQCQPSEFLNAGAKDSTLFSAEGKYLYNPTASGQPNINQYQMEAGLNLQKSVLKKLESQAFIGAALYRNALLLPLGISSTPNEFYNPKYGRIYGSGTAKYAVLLRFSLKYPLGKRFAFLAGYDNQQFGYGNRSAFRDQFSVPMPYLGYSYALNQNISYRFQLDYGANSALFGSAELGKFLVTHSLRFEKNRWDVFVFESVTWRNQNENGYRGIEPLYLAPLVVFRPAEFALGSSDNVLLGAGFQFKIVDLKSSQLSFYSQLLLDEFLYAEVVAGDGWWANKHALNTGVRFIGKKPKQQTEFKLEYNHARPFMYTHSDALQSYTNGAFSAAHPLGANFREIRSELNVQRQKIAVLFNFSQVFRTQQNALNDGSSVTESSNTRAEDYGHTIAKVNGTTSTFFRLRFSYQKWIKSAAFVEVQSTQNQVAIGVGVRYGLKNPFANDF